MDINQKDRAALEAKRCPDCGNQVIFEGVYPWCLPCNNWFEVDGSGWVIRNNDAAGYFFALRGEKRTRRARARRKDLKA